MNSETLHTGGRDQGQLHFPAVGAQPFSRGFPYAGSGPGHGSSSPVTHGPACFGISARRSWFSLTFIELRLFLCHFVEGGSFAVR